MAITSSSTLNEIMAEYMDNAGWEGDSTKAAAFLKACRYLLIKFPLGQTVDGQTFTRASLQSEIDSVKQYVDANSRSGTRVTRTVAEY